MDAGKESLSMNVHSGLIEAGRRPLRSALSAENKDGTAIVRLLMSLGNPINKAEFKTNERA